jgi:tellurite resistance protein TerC
VQSAVCEAVWLFELGSRWSNDTNVGRHVSDGSCGVFRLLSSGDTIRVRPTVTLAGDTRGMPQATVGMGLSGCPLPAQVSGVGWQHATRSGRLNHRSPLIPGWLLCGTLAVASSCALAVYLSCEFMDTSPLLFPLSEYWWFYAGFTVFVLLILALDLGVFHRKAHEVSIKEAAIWSVVWVALSLAFCTGFYYYCLWHFPQVERLMATPSFSPGSEARQSALEFITGYIVEKSLSVDNIFIFVVVFSYFGIPAKFQHRILFYGILGALVFRMIFISIGSVLMQYHWMVVVFGVFLLITGVKVIFTSEKPLEPERNPLYRLLMKFFPLWPTIEGQQFFHFADGKRYATPLFVGLCFIEMTDIIFAVDSVPAIFAITKEPLIVYTSNVLAILGLRAMYFLLAGVMDKFRFLKYGLGIVLIFVGLKMVWLNEVFDDKFPTTWSLGIIGGVILAAVMASLVIPPREKI